MLWPPQLSNGYNDPSPSLQRSLHSTGHHILPSVQHTHVDVQRRARTVVVGGLQDSEEVVRLAVLREDADAPEGALLAGNVQGGISSEVPDFQVASSLQKMLSNFRLIGDHC